MTLNEVPHSILCAVQTVPFRHVPDSPVTDPRALCKLNGIYKCITHIIFCGLLWLNSQEISLNYLQCEYCMTRMRPSPLPATVSHRLPQLDDTHQEYTHTHDTQHASRCTAEFKENVEKTTYQRNQPQSTSNLNQPQSISQRDELTLLQPSQSALVFSRSSP